MAFGRLERAATPQPMSDINMTPLIDVMLVLLVIFMIAAPLMTSSLKLDLPRADGAAPSDAPAFLAVTLTTDGQLHLGEQAVSDAAFDTRVRAAAERDPALEVRLSADRRVPYGEVAALIGRLQQAGLNRIAFVAEPVHSPAAATPSAR